MNASLWVSGSSHPTHASFSLARLTNACSFFSPYSHFCQVTNLPPHQQPLHCWQHPSLHGRTEQKLTLFAVCLIISCSSSEDCLMVHWSRFCNTHTRFVWVPISVQTMSSTHALSSRDNESQTPRRGLHHSDSADPTILMSHQAVTRSFLDSGRSLHL